MKAMKSSFFLFSSELSFGSSTKAEHNELLLIFTDPRPRPMSFSVKMKIFFLIFINRENEDLYLIDKIKIN